MDNLNLTDAEIIVDLEIVDPIKGKSKIVRWCGIEIGFVRQLAGGRYFDAQTRKQHRGQWFDPFAPHGFFPTAEAAACDLIRECVKRNSNLDVIQAALRKDYEFIRAYRQKLVADVTIVDD